MIKVRYLLKVSENELSQINVFVTRGNIEIILESLDGIKRAEAPPFFYGKIRARLDVPKKSILDKIDDLFARPVIAVSLVFIIILMDGIVIQSTLKHISDTYENTANGIKVEDDFDEIMDYDISYNEYAFNY